LRDNYNRRRGRNKPPGKFPMPPGWHTGIGNVRKLTPRERLGRKRRTSRCHRLSRQTSSTSAIATKKARAIVRCRGVVNLVHFIRMCLLCQ
jgi:hypothetical protein